MSDAPHGARPALTIALALGLLALGLAVALRPTADWDVFWHLAIGRAELGGAPGLATDPFSFSVAGAPWRYRDLVADVVLFGAFRVAGYAGLTAIKALAVSAMVAALGWIAPREQRRPEAWLLAGGVLVAAVQYRVAERPLLFTLAAAPAMLGALARLDGLAEAASTRSRAGRVALVLGLQWAWACLHREALVGLGVIGTWCAARLLALACGRAPRLAAWLGPAPRQNDGILIASVPVAAALVTALNPSGLEIYRTAFAVAGSAVYRATISEFARVGLREALRAFPAAVGLAALAAALLIEDAVRAARGRPARAPLGTFPALLFAFFAWQSARSIRWLPHLAIVSAAVVYRAGAATLAARLRGRRTSTTLVALCGLGMVVLVSALNPDPWGVGPARDRYPAGALRFAREAGLRGPVVNAFEYGGYAIFHGWPWLRVLIDGRNDMVYPPGFTVRCFAAQRDPAVFAEMRASDGASWVLASNTAGRESHAFLAGDRAWAMVYWSEAAVLYVRVAEHAALAQRARYRFVDPRAITGSVGAAFAAAHGDPAALSALESELRRMLAASPEGVRSNSVLALFLHAAGPARWPERDAVLRRLVALHGEHPAVQEVLRRVGAR